MWVRGNLAKARGRWPKERETFLSGQRIYWNIRIPIHVLGPPQQPDIVIAAGAALTFASPRDCSLTAAARMAEPAELTYAALAVAARVLAQPSSRQQACPARGAVFEVVAAWLSEQGVSSPSQEAGAASAAAALAPELAALHAVHTALLLDAASARVLAQLASLSQAQRAAADSQLSPLARCVRVGMAQLVGEALAAACAGAGLATTLLSVAARVSLSPPERARQLLASALAAPPRSPDPLALAELARCLLLPALRRRLSLLEASGAATVAALSAAPEPPSPASATAFLRLAAGLGGG